MSQWGRHVRTKTRGVVCCEILLQRCESVGRLTLLEQRPGCPPAAGVWASVSLSR